MDERGDLRHSRSAGTDGQVRQDTALQPSVELSFDQEKTVLFVKDDSEELLVRVEEVNRKKENVHVLWMKEDGPEFVMENGYAWLSVDTIQDIAPKRRERNFLTVPAP